MVASATDQVIIANVSASENLGIVKVDHSISFYGSIIPYRGSYVLKLAQLGHTKFRVRIADNNFHIWVAMVAPAMMAATPSVITVRIDYLYFWVTQHSCAICDVVDSSSG
ncbi:hypothetical protein AOG28_02475 [Cobetia sp. UCD-24C]|nr:hypothetical protein AOG28_02475 [Cobetia sp. UCD-24C]